MRKTGQTFVFLSRICNRARLELFVHPIEYNHPSMRILLLNQAFVSPDEPGHTRHFEMARFLRERGHELVIVASDLNYQTRQRIVAQQGIYTEQVIDGVRILRSFIYPALHRSYIWRVVSFLSFMFSSVWSALQVKDVDL